MSDKDNDEGGFPEELFRRMNEGHKKFIDRQCTHTTRESSDVDKHGGNHALQDYQMQLMFLEKQNKERLRLAREEQDTLRQQHNNKQLAQDIPPETTNISDKIFEGAEFWKQLVDTKINSFFESFRSLPHNVAELRRSMQQEQATRLANEEETFRRWTGITEYTSDHAALIAARRSKTTQDEARHEVRWMLESAWRNNAYEDDKIQKLYASDSWHADSSLEAHSTPMLSSPGSACEYKRENADNGYNMVSTGNVGHWRWPTSQRWLSPSWFKYSPYSPVHLAIDQCGDLPETYWKARFEDLLRVSMGKEMAPVSLVMPDDKGPGYSWLTRLYHSGTLPPPPRIGSLLNDVGDLRTAWHKSATLTQLTEDELMYDHELYDRHELREEGDLEETEGSSPGTELAMYELTHTLRNLRGETERLRQEMEALGLAENDASGLEEEQGRSTPSHVGRQRVQKDIQSDKYTTDDPSATRKKVDILSSLTTTHTIRHADGTVTTKIVLKEKFADGREETQEKTHTYHESASASEPDTKEIPPQDSRKRGWFWN